MTSLAESVGCRTLAQGEDLAERQQVRSASVTASASVGRWTIRIAASVLDPWLLSVEVEDSEEEDSVELRERSEAAVRKLAGPGQSSAGGISSFSVGGPLLPLT